jgi:Protein of unknown function (DUF3800)
MAGSDYITYFDESGDHGMVNIDKSFPVFVLCACLFKIENYLAKELGAFSQIKFKYFGYDAVVFHSRDIRKRIGPFQILANDKINSAFMADINACFEATTGTLIAAGIDKNKHKAQYKDPFSPYDISLLFCLERLYACLKDRGETGKTMFCVFEERGPNEDQELAFRFEKICAGQNMWGKLPFRMVFANKKTNMPGLQFADLAAYPIARHIMHPDKTYQPYEILKKKFRCSPQGKPEGWGLKIFP